MKLIVLFFFMLPSICFGQDYWQQEVNYSIQVELNDIEHSLEGEETFEYINNSPDQLNKIYIHVWPNAYENGTTALAQQQYGNGNNQLKHISDKDKGSIKKLDFSVNGEKAKWEFHHHHDIVILTLNQTLNPGERIIVSTPFTVKIPTGSISRLGHIGQSYQITQWYPKPAVYDKEGWHYMPYLNQGEFYSEFGSFDVSITLPKNYIIAATGDLKTVSEVDYLNSIAKETEDAINSGKDLRNIEGWSDFKTFPKSDTAQKTIRYTQSNVHDFAWFADKRFSVLKGEVELPHSKRKVTTWAMYTPNESSLWKDASEYLHDAIYYYSLWNGDYPYNNVSAVDGTISAGGGMEYPNVTVIGRSGNAHQLEVVIVHEVGHNWFYGQLGTNERVHGWMDEGMNTLNEIRYIQTKYPDNTAMSDMVLNGAMHLNDLDHHDMADISYRTIAGLGEDQPIETHSVEFTSTNYGIIMYQKTGIVFFYLKDYLGDELFDKCMLEYYREWEFKHPQPEDMKTSIEKTSGKNLNWLFKDLIQTTNHIDYKLLKVKHLGDSYEVVTKNVGQVNGPIEINGFLDGKLVVTEWVDPGEKKQTIELKEPLLDYVVIDNGRDIPEMSRQNNTSRTKGIFKKYEPLKFEFLTGDNEAEYTNVFWTPTISGNAYDQMMLGVAIHNFSAPTSRFNYLIAPAYSFGRNYVSGISELGYTFLPKRFLKTSKFGLSIKSFKNDSTFSGNDSHFITVSPLWQAKIGNRGYNSPISQYVRVQSMYKKTKLGPKHIEHAGFYVLYNYDYIKQDVKINFKLRNDFITDVNSSESMARMSAEVTFKLKYLKNKMDRWAEIRLYGGQQYIRDFGSSMTQTYSMSLAGASGNQDLFVDEYYFGRNELSGLWSQQRDENMGGFKSANGYGSSSIAIVSSTIYIDLPIPKLGFIGAFADIGAFHDGTYFQSVFNAGLGVRISNVFGVYFPVFVSSELENSFISKNYAKRIRFTLKFNLFNKPLNIKSVIG